MQLDAAAPVLAALKDSIVIAKVDADKFTNLAKKYDVEYVSFWPIHCLLTLSASYFTVAFPVLFKIMSTLL